MTSAQPQTPVRALASTLAWSLAASRLDSMRASRLLGVKGDSVDRASGPNTATSETARRETTEASSPWTEGQEHVGLTDAARLSWAQLSQAPVGLLADWALALLLPSARPLLSDGKRPVEQDRTKHVEGPDWSSPQDGSGE
ncbi:unnamed protein product [Protopolystoma xenopodis]|uniref:Uncharacterized protein n=1 Tax=Protopolystoma xenopodis TaxID=117903 RepID=A0A3S5ANU0_9PLAT|nr:unnamed protein product [Protopolystoma xenopodis]